MSLDFHAKQLKGARVMATFNLLCKVYSQVELKQILNLLGYSLGYISIRIPREYSDTHLYRFSALILACFVIKHIF